MSERIIVPMPTAHGCTIDPKSIATAHATKVHR